MNKTLFRRRIYVTGLVLSVVVFFFTIRLFNLHFSDRIILPESQALDTGRGIITDRNGYILAISIEMESLYANPEEIKDPDSTAAALSHVTGIPAAEIREKFAKKTRFVWIKRKLDDQDAESVRKLNIHGLHFLKEYRRAYPYRELAANVLGFVGVDNTGLEGIEFRFNSLLSGRDEVVTDEISRKVYRKKNLKLTIDRYIQHVAEEELDSAMRTHGATQGAVIILEVGTGRILAIAKRPGYDPNWYYRYGSRQIANFSIVDSFEPGSTLKLFSMAALFEYRPDALNKSYFCDGKVEVSGVVINCLHNHGTLDIYGVIRESCNAGVIQSVKTLEKDELYDTLKKFGFGELTGIELPGETAGILRPVSKWSGLSKYSMSIGHEISVTSVQLAAAVSAIANGGVYLYPSIVEGIERPDGSLVREFYPRSKGRVMKYEHARTVMQMMRDVVRSGTGKRAESVYYEIAGKTGTSQKFIMAEGAYSDRNVSSFAGFAPYGDPRICMVVIIDDPVDKVTGGASAAPVFARITDRILPYLGIGGRNGLSASIKSSSRLVYRPGGIMPDLRGMTVGQVSVVLKALEEETGAKYYIRGSGRVYGQRPEPGVVLGRNGTVLVYMR